MSEAVGVLEAREVPAVAGEGEGAGTRRGWDRRAGDFFAVLLGVTITLCISGYQFGRGNHTVYLLDALRQMDPRVLANDWFTVHTFQYHAVFTYLTSGLTRLGLVEPAFLAIYLALALSWHVGWLKLVGMLGGTRMTYLVSVLVYYACGAGISIGVYQFLQDACFLPSNVSNVAMLWGLLFWCGSRYARCGLALGIAGAFHINFAVGAVAMWFGLSVWLALTPIAHARARMAFLTSRSYLLGATLMLLLGAINLVPAFIEKMHNSGSLPMAEFVDLYVRFRHTHHLDPLHYTPALWIAFLLPIPLAVVGYVVAVRQASDAITASARRNVGRFFVILLACEAFSVLFAGVFWASGLLVQLSIHRFSIYVKLLSCVGAAWLLWDAKAFDRRNARGLLFLVPMLLTTTLVGLLTIEPPAEGAWALVARMTVLHLRAIILLIGLCLLLATYSLYRRPSPWLHMIGAVGLVAVLLVGWQQKTLGVGMAPAEEERDMLAVSEWARTHSDLDDVFLVPPNDSGFRLNARRAVVVNFKHVPQLGGELPEWRDRLKATLGIDDLLTLPRGYDDVIEAIRRIYADRPAAGLIETAERYGARYIVSARRLDDAPQGTLVLCRQEGTYFVYDRKTLRK